MNKSKYESDANACADTLATCCPSTLAPTATKSLSSKAHIVVGLTTREWDTLYLTTLTPLMYITLCESHFLIIQSIYYIYIYQSDPIHHLWAAFCCMYEGICNPYGEIQVTAAAVMIAEWMNGLLIWSRFPKSMSRAISLIGRLVAHPVAMYYYVHSWFHRCNHIFFLGVALYHIFQFLWSTLRSAPYLLVLIRGRLLGIPTAYCDDPETVRAILMHSTEKGSFVEHVVAIPAWRPVRSIESEDGTGWKQMKSDFLAFMMTLPKLDVLHNITMSHIQRLITSDVVINSRRISELTVAIFLEWMSGSWDQHVVTTLCDGIQEWRKELAVKGPGSMALKQAAITSLASHLQLHESLISHHIIQPFFISPAINITDILCHVKHDGTQEKTKTNMMSLVMSSILRGHPFPMLERYITIPIGNIPAHTQVFIPIAAMAKAPNAQEWMVFGVGPRACPGRHIALTLLQEMCWILPQSSQFKPTSDHMYSGRINDHNTPHLMHTMKTLICAVVRDLALSRARCLQASE